MKKAKRFSLFLALVLVAALLLSSVPAWADALPGHGRSLAEVRQALEAQLLSMADAGFVGITHSEAEGEVIVFVEDEQAERRVPRSFQGYTVRTEVTGRIQALSAQVAEPLSGVSVDRRRKVRPLVGGTSLSAWVVTGGRLRLYTGTLGMVTYDNRILSNAHVIAMHPETGEFLSIGTPVMQPGTGDWGTWFDRVGELDAYIPIDYSPGARNYADAAVASIDRGVLASPGTQYYEQGNYWIEGWTEARWGDTVRKSGCVTGVTTGNVIYTDVSVRVMYGNHTAYFVDQIAVSSGGQSFTAPGDSGSAVDKDGQFVGLVFAGSESGEYAFINKARHILKGLNNIIAFEPFQGQHNLTITSTAGGSVTQPGEGMFVYGAGQVVTLVAQPDERRRFVRWSGDVGTIANVNAPRTTITMKDSYSIMANFELEEGWCSLTISSTEGGSVTQPGEGMFVYPVNTVVSLVAQADQGYRFVEWTGDVSAIGNPRAASTNITLSDSYSITANFELDPDQHSLTISSTAGGSVTKPGEGTFVYRRGQIVELVARADEGHKFVKWSGDVGTIADPSAARTTIVINGSYSITANFESWHPEPVAILQVSSTEGGSVTSPGEGSFPCSLGSQVILVAEADTGYQFDRWSGEVDTIADVYASTTIIIMDSSYSIRADFKRAGQPCCTVAAAYSTPLAKQVGVLRDFRDQYLLTNPLGRTLSHLYYTLSPPVAQLITEHPGLKPVVRAGLVPAVAMSTIAVNTAPAEKAALIGMFVLFSAALAIWLARRRARTAQRA